MYQRIFLVIYEYLFGIETNYAEMLFSIFNNQRYLPRPRTTYSTIQSIKSARSNTRNRINLHGPLRVKNSKFLCSSTTSTVEMIKICFAIQNRGRKRIVRFVVSSRDTIVWREPSSVWLRAPASTRCKSHKSFIKAIETTRLRAVLPLTTERVSLIFRRASGPAGDIRGPQGIVAEIQRLKSLTTVRNDEPAMNQRSSNSSRDRYVFHSFHAWKNNSQDWNVLKIILRSTSRF